MADHTDQVIPENLPLPIEENDTMAKMTVAQLHAKHEALTIQVDNLTHALTEALETVETQNQNIATLELETKRAHDRLDKARDIIRSMKENGAQVANTKAKQSTRQARPASKAGDRRHACTVPGNPHGDEQVTHTTTELNACWQQFYAAKTNS